MEPKELVPDFAFNYFEPFKVSLENLLIISRILIQVSNVWIMGGIYAIYI